MTNVNWHVLGAEEVLQHLKTEKTGLTQQEVEHRLQKYGANRLNH